MNRPTVLILVLSIMCHAGYVLACGEPDTASASKVGGLTVDHQKLADYCRVTQCQGHSLNAAPDLVRTGPSRSPERQDVTFMLPEIAEAVVTVDEDTVVVAVPPASGDPKAQAVDWKNILNRVLARLRSAGIITLSDADLENSAALAVTGRQVLFCSGHWTSQPWNAGCVLGQITIPDCS